MAKLTIPQTHSSAFKYFIDLEQSLKNQLFEAIIAAQYTSDSQELAEYLASKISEIPENNLLKIADIFISLMFSYNKAKISINDFLVLIESALLKIGITNDTDFLDSFKQLLLSGQNFYNAIEVLNLMAENPITYLDSTIKQDIRPVFDVNKKLIGSALIHQLKFLVKENNQEKEIIIALDNIDVKALLLQLEVAIDNIELIEKEFPNAKFY